MATVTVTNIQDLQGGSRQISPVSGSAPKSTNLGLSIAMMLVVIVVAVIMWFAYSRWIKPNLIVIKTGYVPFAGLVVVTAALERLLEPVSLWLDPTKNEASSAANSKAVAESAAADPGISEQDVQERTQAAAKDQAALDGKRADRTVIFWAIASVCGLVVAGCFGFFLLQSVASSHVNSFLDLGITGLAIGAGTKPLHDLITSIQSNASGSSSP